MLRNDWLIIDGLSGFVDMKDYVHFSVRSLVAERLSDGLLELSTGEHCTTYPIFAFVGGKPKDAIEWEKPLYLTFPPPFLLTLQAGESRWRWSGTAVRVAICGLGKTE